MPIFTSEFFEFDTAGYCYIYPEYVFFEKNFSVTYY